MDWDWEDGPPRDAPPPRRAPDEPPSRAPDEPTLRAPDEPPEREPDEEQTVFRPPRPDQERPGPGATEAAGPGAPAEAAGRLQYDEPPPTQDERTARRARRRKQIRQRRLIALGVAIAVVVLLVILVIRGCGGPSPGQASAQSSPTPAVFRSPTAAQPLRMAAYGESVGGGALLGVKLLTEQRKDIKVHRYVKVASGLTRPDFFDWPAYLEQDMAKRAQPFEAVLLVFGANDGQDTKVDGKRLAFGSDAWKAMYARRVGAVMDFYLKNGVRKVYWAGMPRMGIGWFTKRMELMNGIYKTEAASRSPKVEYIDSWKAVDAPATTYQAKYRQDDGVHLTVEGGTKAAKAVLAAVARDWHLPSFEARE